MPTSSDSDTASEVRRSNRARGRPQSLPQRVPRGTQATSPWRDGAASSSAAAPMTPIHHLQFPLRISTPPQPQSPASPETVQSPEFQSPLGNDLPAAMPGVDESGFSREEMAVAAAMSAVEQQTPQVPPPHVVSRWKPRVQPPRTEWELLITHPSQMCIQCNMKPSWNGEANEFCTTACKNDHLSQ